VIFPVIIDIRCRLRHDWPSELRDGSTPGAPGVGYSKTAALVMDLVILAAGVTSGLAGAMSVAPVAEYIEMACHCASDSNNEDSPTHQERGDV